MEKIPGWIDSLPPADEHKVVLPQSTALYERAGRHQTGVAYKQAVLDKGSEILVGGTGCVVNLILDKKVEFFVPWLDDEIRCRHPEDQAKVACIRISDLPQEIQSAIDTRFFGKK